MVVLVIDYIGVAIRKFEGYSPISIYPNRPAQWFEAFELMESKSRDVHIVNDPGRVQSCKLHTEAILMLWLDAGSSAPQEELLNSLVLERFDHVQILACCASRNNRRITPG